MGISCLRRGYLAGDKVTDMGLDLVIRGGMLVDGTGVRRRVADVGVREGRIVEVGRVSDRGKREIEADGLLVTPGFVDIHGHYDGQVTWDGHLAPSSHHGVTSVVMGNCGVGFAPARPGEDAHEFLIALMEGVEDIPGGALSEGLPWAWESYGQYLDFLADRPMSIDVGGYVPHAALRTYVMGERGGDHTEAPTSDEISTMRHLLGEALAAGAMGFSTSRSWNHRSRDGQPIGSLEATRAELLGVLEALRQRQEGVIQLVSDFDDLDAELDLMVAMARTTGRPLTTSVAQVDRAPGRWRTVLDRMEAEVAAGQQLTAQICLRPTGLLLGLETSMNPFMLCPSFCALADRPLAERVRTMADPATRAAILSEHGTTEGLGMVQRVTGAFERLFRLGEHPEYEPPRDQSLAAEARRLGVEPKVMAYDALLEHEGRGLLYFPVGNYVDYNLDAAAEMFRSPVSVFGLSDGGAHVGVICDASFPTYHLSYWCRDRTRGDRLQLEEVVNRQTARSAGVVGWKDRGIVAPGYKADLNVIDFDHLDLKPPHVVYDLPAGGRRLLQEAEGYVATICAGVVTFENGKETGARPGRVVRGAQSGPA
jgi:N-acyl-D-aspartate/D-glutamate deacylase